MYENCSHQRFLKLLLLLQLVIQFSNGFVYLQWAPPKKQNEFRTQKLPIFYNAIPDSELHATRDGATVSEEDENDLIDNVRRALLSSLSVAGIVALSMEFNGNPINAATTTTRTLTETVDPIAGTQDGQGTGIIRELDSLDEALQVIATSCDRRFLEAIVSSNYRLLYRGVDEEKEGGPIIGIRREASDLLDPSTYDSVDAANYFASLEDSMKLRNSPIRPSNGHLAVTSIDDARAWGGYAVSVWPLVSSSPTRSNSGSDDGEDGVHFAWLEEGGVFWPNKDSTANPQSVLVDGIDCGRQALEDALQGDGWEIMFNSESFLSVPASMDRELIAKLKHAYLI